MVYGHSPDDLGQFFMAGEEEQAKMFLSEKPDYWINLLKETLDFDAPKVGVLSTTLLKKSFFLNTNDTFDLDCIGGLPQQSQERGNHQGRKGASSATKGQPRTRRIEERGRKGRCCHQESNVASPRGPGISPGGRCKQDQVQVFELLQPHH